MSHLKGFISCKKAILYVNIVLYILINQWPKNYQQKLFAQNVLETKNTL